MYFSSKFFLLWLIMLFCFQNYYLKVKLNILPLHYITETFLKLQQHIPFLTIRSRWRIPPCLVLQFPCFANILNKKPVHPSPRRRSLQLLLFPCQGHLHFAFSHIFFCHPFRADRRIIRMQRVPSMRAFPSSTSARCWAAVIRAGACVCRGTRTGCPSCTPISTEPPRTRCCACLCRSRPPRSISAAWWPRRSLPCLQPSSTASSTISAGCVQRESSPERSV